MNCNSSLCCMLVYLLSNFIKSYVTLRKALQPRSEFCSQNLLCNLHLQSTHKIYCRQQQLMKTITGDTRTLDFFKSTSWSRIWFEFLGTLRLLCWDLMFGQANNQMHIADHVGTICRDCTDSCEASLGYALKFLRWRDLLLKYNWMVILPLQRH